MKLVEVLARPTDWWHGHDMPSINATCIMLAADRVEGARGVRRMVRLLGFSDEIDKAGAMPGYWQATDWNDHPDRTFAEVHALAEAFDRDRLVNP